MASYLGLRLGQKVVGKTEGITAFDNLPFPTRPAYTGWPWFPPPVVAWYRGSTGYNKSLAISLQ